MLRINDLCMLKIGSRWKRKNEKAFCIPAFIGSFFKDQAEHFSFFSNIPHNFWNGLLWILPLADKKYLGWGSTCIIHLDVAKLQVCIYYLVRYTWQQHLITSFVYPNIKLPDIMFTRFWQRSFLMANKTDLQDINFRLKF